MPTNDVPKAAGAQALLHLPGAAGLRLQGRRAAHGGAAALGSAGPWPRPTVFPAPAPAARGAGGRPPLKEPRGGNERPRVRAGVVAVGSRSQDAG